MDRLSRIAWEFDRKLAADAKEKNTHKELLKACADYIQVTTTGMMTRMSKIERQLRYVTDEKVLMRHIVDSLISIISDLIIEAQKWVPEADNAKVMALLKQGPPNKGRTGTKIEREGREEASKGSTMEGGRGAAKAVRASMINHQGRILS